MSGGDLPPRQKMIGMMYLVLTALLALNISKSILDAFVNINRGIQTTAISFDANNQFLYTAFDKAAQTGGENGKKWAAKAEKVKKMANDMYNHIDRLKAAIYRKADGIEQSVADTIHLEFIDAKDNYDAPTHLMGLAEPAKPVKVKGEEEFSGITLREELNKYHAGILGVFESKDTKDEIEEKIKYLETNPIKNDDGNDDPWEVGLFYHVPMAAVVCQLSKIQSDVRTSEAEVIAKLYESIDAGGVSFNKIQGMAVLPKAYIMDTDTFRADIFTAAYDDRVDPEIYVFSSSVTGGVDSAAWQKGETDPKKLMKGTEGKAWGEGDWYQMDPKDVSAGRGQLSIKESIGTHDWGGIIKLNTKKGPKVYPFNSFFEVGKPSLAVSADKMNVFYIGVDNPVSISAPMPNFTASAPGLSKSGKGWVMRPKKRGTVNIVVTGIDTDGSKKPLGKVEFRCKRIPDPKSYCAGKSGSDNIKKIAFSNASTVQAKMEGFDFDIKVRVSSFMFSTTKAGVVQEIRCQGNQLNAQAKSMIKQAKRNQKFFIEKVKVSMPDGTSRQLAPIILKVI